MQRRLFAIAALCGALALGLDPAPAQQPPAGALWIGQGPGAVAQWLLPTQDCTFGTNGTITCLKTNNVAFGPFATATNLSGFIIGNGTNAPTAYGGATCINQFIRDLSTSGAPTCNSVANTDLTNSTVTVQAGTNTGITVTGGNALALGGTLTLGSTGDTWRATGLGLGGAAPLTGIELYNAAAAPTANGQLVAGASAANGAIVGGQGSTNDVSIENKGGTIVCDIATGATAWLCNAIQTSNGLGVGTAAPGSGISDLNGLGVGTAAPASGILVTGAAMNPSGNNQAIFGSSATNGNIILGQGSTSDVVIQNRTPATVCSIATGATIWLCNAIQASNGLGVGTTPPVSGLSVNNGVGVGIAAPANGISVAGAAVTPSGNGQANLGASSTNGEVLIGQGSTNDLTLQNKSAGTVCKVLTGTTTLTCNNVDVQGNALVDEIPNAGVTGTTLNKLAKLTGAPSTAVIAATSDTSGVYGIVIGGAGITGNALIAKLGQASCVFDGATTAGDYAQISGTVAGDCHDATATLPGSGQIIGRVLSTNGAGGTYAVALFGPAVQGNSGGGTVTSVNSTPCMATGANVTSNGSVAVPCPPPQGRLTLTSGTPYMSAGVTSGGTLYYDCSERGNTVPYYNGTIDQLDVIASCEVSTAMQTTGTGVLNANDLFDAFYSSAHHTICLVANGSGGGWKSDTGGGATARGTGYTQLHNTRGYYTNVNALTHCYNGTTDYGSIAADQGTYLGTVCTDAASAGKVSMTLDWSTQNANGSPTASARNCLWNQYNRVEAKAFVLDTMVCPYRSNVIQEHCGNTTDSIFILFGNPIEAFQAAVTDQIGTQAVATAAGFFGPGVDDKTTFYKSRCYIQAPAAAVTFAEYNCATFVPPQVGLHEITMNEGSDNVNSNNFGCGSGACGVSAKWMY